MRYHANIERIKAERDLESPWPKSAERLRDLAMKATGDERLASRLWSEAKLAEARADKAE